MALVQQFDIDLPLPVGALAAGAAVIANSRIDAARENGFRIVKSQLFLTLTGKTTAEGPIAFGVAMNVPNAAAITAILDADPSDSKADISRGEGVFVKILGVLGLLETSFPPISRDGPGWMMEISYGKNGWSIPEGRGLVYWARNNDGSALTTGTILTFSAEHFGVWLRD